MVTKSVTRHPWGHHKTARVHLKHRLFGENGTVQRLLPLIDLDRGFAVAGSLCSCIKHAAAAPGYPLQNHKSNVSHKANPIHERIRERTCQKPEFLLDIWTNTQNPRIVESVGFRLNEEQGWFSFKRVCARKPKLGHPAPNTTKPDKHANNNTPLCGDNSTQQHQWIHHGIPLLCGLM